MHRPEVHDVLRRWRAIADAYDPPRILLGETWALDHADLARYYGEDGEELHLAFNFPFAKAPFRADDLRLVVETTARELGPEAWPVWTASNHDIGRLATRWCGGDPRKIRLALLVLLTLRGTPVLYQGDEIGLPEVDVPPPRRRDHAHARRGSRRAGRDRGRTPMPWAPGPSGGFSPPGVEPWLPLGEPGVDVATQREDTASTLSWARRLMGLRRERPDLRTGGAGALDAPPGAWAWTRGASTWVAVNLSPDEARVAAPDGRRIAVVAATGDVAAADGGVRLGAWSGGVLASEG
jgi:alpha-glucosidase